MKRFLIVLAVLVVCAPSALAGESMSPEQLAGEWSYAQKAGNDVYVDMLVIKMGPDGPAGIMHYRDGDQEKQDVFSHFVVQKTGRIDFISKRPDGKVARHRGYPSNGGNTIRGKYDLGFGVGGAFVLNRSGVDGPAVLSGRWTYHIIDPSGGPGEYGDMLLLGDVGGGFEGYLHYRTIETSPKKFEGRVSRDNAVSFTIYEKKSLEHVGTLSGDGRSISGYWGVSGSHDGGFTMETAAP